MKRALLYAPMNPITPGAPPSGDRAMTGLLARALETIGYKTEPASQLRAYEGAGHAAQQFAIAEAAKAEIPALIARHRGAPPALWITYLSYYKSPDHLGPAVAKALGIPYVIVEASHAPKRATGDFAAPYAAAKSALKSADAVIAMTQHDAAMLQQIVPVDRLHHLPPFIDAARFKGVTRKTGLTPLILSVAMLRPGKKLANFPLIAAALARIADLKWFYVVAGGGDGLAAAQISFANFPKDRITFMGAVPPDAMPALYARADLYLWPGLKEAYGLSYLEAQASGLPVAACDTAGVPAVVEQGRGGLLSPPDDPEALAQSLRILLMNRQTRTIMGEVASEFVHGERDIAHAAQHLQAILAKVVR
jgi:glycosyltransferase involved in cell wall biosynthesis